MINDLLRHSLNSLKPHKSITLTGDQNLSLSEIISVANYNSKVKISPSKKTSQRLRLVREHMIQQVKNGTPIYGATTAYGGQAGLVLNEGIQKIRLKSAKELSDSIIHVDVSTGDPIPENITRAAMLIRINMLLPGFSAVRLSTLKHLQLLLNQNITPIVGQFGTVGASGDLAQNGRILSTLLHNKQVQVKSKGQILPARKALRDAGIPKLTLEPKEGLGLTNGDNFSTAAATIIVDELTKLLILNQFSNSLTIQALKGTDRNYHPLLHTVRPHKGQAFTAKLLRHLLKDSKLAYQELKSIKTRDKGVNVQDVYSIRCLPQYYGPDFEALSQALKTIEINANSVSDNPLWTTPETTTKDEDPYQWVSGGNFLAMHMSDTLDKLRKIAVHIVKQNDRHMARLIHPDLNNGLPPNLSDKSAISQCVFKGLQTQMGMYEVYAGILAAPVSTAFGVHEQLNQDITSHAFTSAIMTREVLKLVRYSLATNLISSCQAIDLRGGPQLLSPSTKFLYEWIRSQVPYVKKEQPLGHYVELVSENILDINLLKTVFSKTIKAIT